MNFEATPIIFVQGVGRSGLDLLRTLIDGHDEILVFPFTDKFNSIWNNNRFHDGSKIDELVEAFLYRSKI